MPTLNSYVDGHGWFIRGRMGGWVTWQVGPQARRWLRRHGYRPGDVIERDAILSLIRTGRVWTYGSGPGTDDYGEPAQPDRDHQAWAGEQLDRVYPSSPKLRHVCRCVAHTLRLAHRINPSVWSTSHRGTSLGGSRWVRIPSRSR